MITVIIAGGSGTRLWPLSTSQYPKHLLKLTNDTSLLQQAYARARQVGETVYIVTEASHAHHVKEQLPDLSDEYFLIEPGRRGTGNCIVFALDVIARRHSHDEPIGFVHSDHNIRDTESYVRSLHLAAEASNVTHKVTLVGIEPIAPSTNFGYIERSQEIDNTGAYVIASFKEKPDHDTAVEYMQAGNYLWNCGYFVGSVSTFLDEIRAVAPDLLNSYDKLSACSQPLNDEYNQVYLSLEDLVIDYALAERSQNLAVVPAAFDWMVISSWRQFIVAKHLAMKNASALSWSVSKSLFKMATRYSYSPSTGRSKHLINTKCASGLRVLQRITLIISSILRHGRITRMSLQR